MSSDGNGYLIPDIPQPDNLRCVRVYVPDDPLYMAVLLGSITYLGTWTAWERDAEKRGSLAAIAWKDANDKTLDELSMGCDGDCPDCPECPDCELCDMTKDELKEIIEEIMTITINNNVCCGGCGSNCGCDARSGVDLTPPEAPPPLPTDWEGSGDIPGIFQDDAQKCNMANYLVYTLRLSLMKAIDHSDDVGAYNEFFRSLWEGIVGEPVANWLSTFDFGIFSWIMSIINGDEPAGKRVADLFDEHFNFLVCKLFQAADEQNAYERMYVEIGRLMGHEQVISQVAQSIAARLPYQLLFAEFDSLTIPAGFENRECCGQTHDATILPSIPAGYVYMIPELSEMTMGGTGYNTTYTAGGVILLTKGSTGQDCQHDVNQVLLTERHGAVDVVGCLVEILSYADNAGEGLIDFPLVNGPDFYFDSVGDDNHCASSLINEYADFPEFAAIIDEWATYKKTWVKPTGLPTCTWETRLNEAKSISYRIVFIGKLAP